MSQKLSFASSRWILSDSRWKNNQIKWQGNDQTNTPNGKSKVKNDPNIQEYDNMLKKMIKKKTMTKLLFKVIVVNMQNDKNTIARSIEVSWKCWTMVVQRQIGQTRVLFF